MQTIEADYIAAYRNLNLSLDAKVPWSRRVKA